jgi:type I restriction enzyme M protein
MRKISNHTIATTSQSLGSLLKSARDIMRKDKGLNGDLDRLPMLTWIMFLKFLDDLEVQREEEAALAGKKFKAAIEKPYRWRDWAANPQGVTGDELLSFINSEETTRPDGKKGAGLFRYLRTLTSSNGDDRRDVIATVFKGVDNRMKSGYLLRDVINKIADIHFTSNQELHTLGALYESMLREMRDAAGDSGEFYTPRAVVRFMVQVTDPRLGEVILDPAAGTGGFLVEAYTHLEKQVKTVGDRRVLQQKTLFGCEPKPLPYLLCQMNLLLHGLDAPQIDPGNALRHKLTEIGEKERVDVILTNPPFGGEEERGIQGNFPEDKQTSETALLFLQLIMRKLRRSVGSTLRDDRPRFARAAVVVPNGTLFGDGVCARLKEELLKEFNLHTIVRLPNGVFAPYTSIPTNILFFDRSGPTREVWYYEQPLPEGRKNYTKTAPIQFEDFTDSIKWWTNREENERAWKLPVKDLLTYDANGVLQSVNLDRKNPHAKEDITHLPPEQLAADILKNEHRIAEIVENIQKLLASRDA